MSRAEMNAVARVQRAVTCSDAVALAFVQLVGADCVFEQSFALLANAVRVAVARGALYTVHS